MPLLADLPAARPLREPRPPREPRLHRPTVLRGVTWEEYAALRAKPENAHVKLTYDGPNGGLLEIEMPLGLEHESLSELIAAFVAAYAQRNRRPYRAVGSVTQSRQDLRQGLEGDKSFYFKSAPLIRGRRRLDLAGGDPPPDLSVEVDVTSRGVDKLPIYAALGVPEVWVWDDGALSCRALADAGEYEEAVESRELPGFPLPLAAELAARWADAETDALVAEFSRRLA